MRWAGGGGGGAGSSELAAAGAHPGSLPPLRLPQCLADVEEDHILGKLTKTTYLKSNKCLEHPRRRDGGGYWKNSGQRPESFLSSYTGLFYWVGVLSVTYLVYLSLSYVVHALRMWVLGNPMAVGLRLGAWAVVMGATDGIGKAYEEELARRGMKVVLISRSQEKLDQVASEIRERFKVETKTVTSDFGDRVRIYQNIKASLEGLEIGILVNNVMVSYSYPEYFLEISDIDKTIDNIVNINIISVCKMTQLVLPSMLERSKGVIVNVSSFAGLQPSPFLTLYLLTKAFVDFLSQCIVPPTHS
ncbi:very-long-chain 3-oxoacyl-CoA reductase-like [Elgaria multicarinata webbii]|uniref:very-long-chain 3-oxoacyl-CoA reductase-like n=1 Tax=Elgaria multicarinata webbii TaxID=159646 RepID=UPI002FCD021B